MTSIVFPSIALPLLVVLLAVVLVRRCYLIVTVQGASMEPTLVDGDRVLVRRIRLTGISVGQLVVTGPPTGGRWDRAALPNLLIKRAAAVPGDPVPREGAPALRDLPEERVPAHRIVLLGDNPAESLDSRFCGYFRDEQILGIAVRRLAPLAPAPAHSYSSSGRTGRATVGKDVPPWPT